MHKKLNLFLVSVVTATSLLKADPTDSNQRGKIDWFHMMIVGKYFKIIDDFVNVEMVNKKYKEIILRYKYNPILLTNERIRKLFSNIETQHIYNKNDIVFHDGLIKHYVHWYAVSYGKTNNTNEVDTYKSVIFTQEDRKKTMGDNPTNATIPPNVTEVGEDCFADCNKLISISIPSSVAVLGAKCFNGCGNLTSISIPSSVSVLRELCFCHCSNLRSLFIPSSVSALGELCFTACNNLTSISIPTNLSVLGFDCFYNCTNLKSITISKKLWNKERLGLSDDNQVHFQEENEPVQMNIAHQENRIELTDSSFEDISDTFSYSDKNL